MGVATADHIILTTGCQSQAVLHLLLALAPDPVCRPRHGAKAQRTQL
jgi:hypothetical protein